MSDCTDSTTSKSDDVNMDDISPNTRYPSLLYTDTNRRFSNVQSATKKSTPSSRPQSDDTRGRSSPPTPNTPSSTLRRLENSGIKKKEKEKKKRNKKQKKEEKKTEAAQLCEKREEEDKGEDEDDTEFQKKDEQSAIRRQSTVLAKTPRLLTSYWRLTPWTDWTEWLLMKQLLFKNQFKAAEKLLSLFRMRRQSVIPVAMSSSVSLVSMLNDEQDVHERRLGLSMAIIRLVNGITDVLQPRDVNRQSRSISSGASLMELPPILVDIRHQATHGTLPGLQVMEYAARHALIWLDVHYWQPQHKMLVQLELLKKNRLNIDVSIIKHVFTPDWFEDRKESIPGQEKKNGEEIAQSDTTESRGGDYMEGLVLTKRAEEKKFGEEALNRLKLCIQKMKQKEKREKKRADAKEKVEIVPNLNREKNNTVGVKVMASGRTGGIWSECSNHGKWKNLPIGLIPGQSYVPRLTTEVLIGAKGIGAKKGDHDNDFDRSDDDDDGCYNSSSEDESEDEDENEQAEPWSEESEVEELGKAQENQIRSEIKRLKSLVASTSDQPESNPSQVGASR